jgi:magnesium-transporting ATPase (P-type)
VIATINILNSFFVFFGLCEFKTVEDNENTSITYFSETDAEIYSELLEMDSSDDSNSESFENTPWWFPLIVSASQQLCGLNAINFYLQQIFQTPEEDSGTSGLFSRLDSNMYAIIITFVQVLITGSAGYLLYHRGLSNKSNMLTSCLIVFVSLAVISGLMFLNINKFYLMFPTLLFQIGFSFGLGPTTWTIIAGSINSKHADKTRYTGQTVAINSLASFMKIKREARSRDEIYKW